MPEPLTDDTLRIGDVEIRPAEYQVLVANRRIGLTIREFETFHALVERRGRVVTRAEIYDAVWGGQISHRDRSVDVYVRKVRNKLAAASPRCIYIHTHFGIGYRFDPEPVD